MIQAQRGLNGFGIGERTASQLVGRDPNADWNKGNVSICRILNSATRARRCNAIIQTSIIAPKPNTNPNIASNAGEIALIGLTLRIYARPSQVQTK